MWETGLKRDVTTIKKQGYLTVTFSCETPATQTNLMPNKLKPQSCSLIKE